MTKLTKKTVKPPTLAQQAAAKVQTAMEESAEGLKGTPAGEIWDEIKDKEILMFALPDQKVNQHVFPINIAPDKLYLRMTSSAVLPSLEVAVGKKFSVELVDKFAVVTRVPPPLTSR